MWAAPDGTHLYLLWISALVPPGHTHPPPTWVAGTLDCVPHLFTCLVSWMSRSEHSEHVSRTVYSSAPAALHVLLLPVLVPALCVSTLWLWSLAYSVHEFACRYVPCWLRAGLLLVLVRWAPALAALAL